MQQVEDEEVEKTRATFHQKPQLYGSMGRATDLHSGSNPAGEQIFFQKSVLFAYTFLKFSFDNTVTWHYKHTSKQDLSEIEHTSSGNWNMLIAN